MKRNSIFALIIVCIGILMLLKNFHLIQAEIGGFILGFAFIAIYIFLGGRNKNYTIVILCISIMLLFYSLFKNLCKYSNNPILLLVLAATSFLLTYFIHNFKKDNLSFQIKYWPILLSTILYVFSIFLFFIQRSGDYSLYFILKYGWPFILICLSIFTLISHIAFKKNN